MSRLHLFHAPLIRLTSVITCFVLLLFAVADMPFDEAKSSHAINLTSNVQTQPQQPVKHFGYLGPSTDSDLSRVHSYTDFTYTDGVYGQSIIDTATLVKNNGMRLVIDLGKVLWCPTSLANDTWHLCGAWEVDYQSRWSNWVSMNSSVLNSSYVLAFSVMTEPVQRTVPKIDLEAAVALVKQTFPQIPTLVAVGSAEVNRTDFYLPNNADWITFFAYYVLHPNLDYTISQEVATLKSKKQSWQRMAYSLDGFYTCPHQQAFLTLDNMDSIAQEWYTFASRDPEAILLGVFAWGNVGAEGDLGSMSFPQHVLDKHAAIGAAILAGRYPTYQGNFDSIDCQSLTGWAWDASQPNTPISVDIYYDNGALLGTVRANQFRQDLLNAGMGNGQHGFTFSLPWFVRNGTHPVTIKYSGLNEQLTNSPRSITCTSPPRVYEGYLEVADCNTIRGWAADRNRLNTPIMVSIYDYGSLIARVVASDLRSDVGAYLGDNGKHGFTIQTPPCFKDGSEHTTRVFFDFGGSELTGSQTGTVTCTTRSNFAAASLGATATASSTYSAGYPTSAVNNGDRKGWFWSVDGGWNDATANSYPDWVQVNFNGTKTIDEIDVFTLQDNYGNPADPTETMTFTTYGITAFDVQYFDGSNWVTVPGGSTAGNNKVWRKFSFAPVTTSRIRVMVNNALASYSRITEVEAWGW